MPMFRFEYFKYKAKKIRAATLSALSRLLLLFISFFILKPVHAFSMNLPNLSNLLNLSSAAQPKYFALSEDRFDISAFWIDSQHMALQLSNPIIRKNSFRFFLRDQATPDATNIELTPLSYNGTNAYNATNTGWIILNTSHIPVSQQKELVRQALVLDVMSDNFLMQRTGIALTSILDDLFYTDTSLGQVWNDSGVDIKVWSPTARQMILHLYTNSEDVTPVASVTMTVKAGVWSVRLSNTYKGYYYQFEAQNFFPELQRYLNNRVTDPYSPGLSADGQKSLLVHLDDPITKPPDWDRYLMPTPLKAIQSVIYENHLRDLTAHDKLLNQNLRGKYRGLATKTSQAYQHLQELKKAGLTHLHLLPFNDFGSVPEKESDQASLPDREWNSPDEASTALARIRSKDNYNWGYDPVHWFSPEGSYATDASGISRILEMREMIQALHQLDLHLTQDVVFNHTYASDFSALSVLHKLVPSYYYRMNAKGVIASTSCCSDTASENRMMEKLMRDSLKFWIKHYHITSFRFDLMSFHSRETMIRLRDSIQSELKSNFNYPEDSVLIYGEAWPFGSLFDRSPELAMTQKNSYGSGFGVFNDRLRDALRGGTTNLAELSDQGFITGLEDHFNFNPRNRNSPLDEKDRREKFLHLKDVVKIGLAGNLKDFYFREHWGSLQTGGSIMYRGAPVAYAHSAQETINYVSAHDGTTLWDAIQAKLAYHSEWAQPSTAPLWMRIRRHQLALSFILFSQGIPFIEGGTEILRTKNGDVDSYDSGDFYNALNFDLSSQADHSSLPPAWKNFSEWDFWSPRLADQTITPRPQDKIETLSLFKTLLKIRKTYDVFKMNELHSIQKRLSFLDDTTTTDPALLPMKLIENNGDQLLIVWNTSQFEKTWQHPILNTSKWYIEPELNLLNIAWLKKIQLNENSIQLPPLSFVVLVQKEALND